VVVVVGVIKERVTWKGIEVVGEEEGGCCAHRCGASEEEDAAATRTPLGLRGVGVSRVEPKKRRREGRTRPRAAREERMACMAGTYDISGGGGRCRRHRGEVNIREASSPKPYLSGAFARIFVLTLCDEYINQI
jgi:hypothetical protein